VAKNPDPVLPFSTIDGVTRPLDDWLTMFHFAIVVLPDSPEAIRFIPVFRDIYKVFGDADVRLALCFPSTPGIARRVLGDVADEFLTFVDPDKAFVNALGLEKLPALVHLRQDTALAGVAEGWDPVAWQKVVNEIGKAMAWTVPSIKDLRTPVPAAYPAA
jgi:hypothetical protein